MAVVTVLVACGAVADMGSLLVERTSDGSPTSEGLRPLQQAQQDPERPSNRPVHQTCYAPSTRDTV
ncbi:hypothetical protein GCM10010307_05380 [Streptomyces vastus]|uniref:Secreted protein n=1 Tax=Streptomyces vastus TaxID=285451 RepID=A0ABP6CMH8_9ACTN